MSSRQSVNLDLPIVAAGNRRSLLVHRYGCGRPKAYLQAALHADEAPGMLALQHLLERLDAAPDQVQGEIVIVPFANPIGLSQFLNGYTLGRYDFDVTGNFNRAVPALGERLVPLLAESLGDDPQANADIIRAALCRQVAALPTQREGEALKALLLSQSIDADYVLDLHCDHDALLHLYAPRDQSTLAQQLAADMHCMALLLEDDPGGEAYDQANSSPWRVLRQHYGERVPLGCFACPLELRGQHEVNDTLAAQDAAGLYRFLQRQGVITGTPETLPPPQGVCVPLEGVDVLRSPGAGLLVYHQALGAQVGVGDVIAELIDVHHINHRIPICSRTEGVLFTRVRDSLVRPGQCVAKIAGVHPLDYRLPGKLLQD